MASMFSNVKEVQTHCGECWKPFYRNKTNMLIVTLPSCEKHSPSKMCLQCVLKLFYKNSPLHNNCDSCQELVKTIDQVRNCDIEQSVPILDHLKLNKLMLIPEDLVCPTCKHEYDNVHHQPTNVNGCPEHLNLVYCRGCLLTSTFFKYPIFKCRACDEIKSIEWIRSQKLEKPVMDQLLKKKIHF